MLVGILMLVGNATLVGAQSSPRAAMLEQDGWAAIKAGDAVRAGQLFREAATLDSKNAALRFGVGLAEFLQRHDPEAKASFEQALALDPKLSIARERLAQVYKRQGDINEAIRLYEIVAGELPGEPGVSDTLDRWTRERDLHERMRQEVGDHFTISFAGPEDAALAAQALESLNKAFWRICDVLGVFPQKPVAVVLYSAEQFSDITRAPKWAGAAFDGIIRVPMRGVGGQADDLDRVLAHEFTHALVRGIATRGLPTWLNEGLASVLERDDLGWANDIVQRTINPPALSGLSGPFLQMSGTDATVAYAVSAVAARRLLDDAGGGAIANLLRDLGAGVDFEDAFLHRIQRSFAEFQASLR